MRAASRWTGAASARGASEAVAPIACSKPLAAARVSRICSVHEAIASTNSSSRPWAPRPRSALGAYQPEAAATAARTGQWLTAIATTAAENASSSRSRHRSACWTSRSPSRSERTSTARPRTPARTRNNPRPTRAPSIATMITFTKPTTLRACRGRPHRNRAPQAAPTLSNEADSREQHDRRVLA